MSVFNKIPIHKPEDFAGMRKAGQLAASVLDYIEPFMLPDITTQEVNDLCHKFIVDAGAKSAYLNYKGFPKSVCTSVNSVVCHGIPGPYKLKDEDIVNVDVTVIVDGWHGDTSRMYAIGDSFKGKSAKVNKQKKLIDSTYHAMMEGIKVIAPGKKLSVIGKAIQNYIDSKGFSIVRDYCGHGIGKTFHTSPNILHYIPSRKMEESENNIEMRPGMFFTVEPMINDGDWQTSLSKKDGWTVTTRDNKLSAQFEHTVAVTESGYEIFTLSPQRKHAPEFVQI